MQGRTRRAHSQCEGPEIRTQFAVAKGKHVNVKCAYEKQIVFHVFFTLKPHNLLPAAWAGACDVTNRSLKAEGAANCVPEHGCPVRHFPVLPVLRPSPCVQMQTQTHTPRRVRRRGAQASDQSLLCLLPPGLSQGSFFSLEYLSLNSPAEGGPRGPCIPSSGLTAALAPLPPALAMQWDSGLGSHTCWVIQHAQNRTTGASGGSGPRAPWPFNYPMH